MLINNLECGFRRRSAVSAIAGSADVDQLVDRDLAEVEATGSSPVVRSIAKNSSRLESFAME